MRGALLAEVSPADVRVILRQVIRIAKRGHLPAVELLLKWVLGAPPAPVDPDRLDEHELDVRRKRPTLLDQLALADDQTDDPHLPPAAAGHVVVGPAGVGRGPDARRPPDPATGWEAFASDRLEWDPQAAVEVDHLYVRYARWCTAHGELVLAEDQVLAWLTQRAAPVRTGAVSAITIVVGVRVVA